MGSTGKKNSSNLEENELNYLLEKFSKDSSVTDLNEFLNSAKAPKAEPKPAEKKAEPKAEKKHEAPKAEPAKAEAKPAAKQNNKKNEQHKKQMCIRDRLHIELFCHLMDPSFPQRWIYSSVSAG